MENTNSSYLYIEQIINKKYSILEREKAKNRKKEYKIYSSRINSNYSYKYYINYTIYRRDKI